VRGRGSDRRRGSPAVRRATTYSQPSPSGPLSTWTRSTRPGSTTTPRTNCRAARPDPGLATLPNPHSRSDRPSGAHLPVSTYRLASIGRYGVFARQVALPRQVKAGGGPARTKDPSPSSELRRGARVVLHLPHRLTTTDPTPRFDTPRDPHFPFRHALTADSERRADTGSGPVPARRHGKW
jgi:hypothetical protein